MTALAAVAATVIAYAALWVIAPTLGSPHHETLEDLTHRRVQEIRARLKEHKERRQPGTKATTHQPAQEGQ